MAKFRVTLREVYLQDVIVEAETPEEAKSLAQDGEGDYDDEPRYDFTIDGDDGISEVRNLDTGESSDPRKMEGDDDDCGPDGYPSILDNM